MESWFVLQVAPQHEKKVAMVLACKGYDRFVPTHKSRQQWSDRTKVIELPLFPGYVFCRSQRSLIGNILGTSGVRRIVGFGGEPYPMPDEEVAALQRIVLADTHPSPCSYLRIGQKVRITEDGPLWGIVGFLTKIKSRYRLVISVEMIMRSISIEVDYSAVEPVTSDLMGIDGKQRQMLAS